MHLHNVIVHQIHKEQNSNEVAIHFAPHGELDCEDVYVEDLVSAIKKAYDRTGSISWGAFEDDPDIYPFKSKLIQFVQSDDDTKNIKRGEDSHFIKLSKFIVKALKGKIEDKPFATGGYIVVAYYSDDESQTPRFLIAMVKDKQGVTFDADLRVVEIQQIDLTKLHMAVEVNVSKIQSQNEDEDCLGFIKGASSTEVAEYFAKAIGCRDLIKNNDAVRSVFNIVNEVCEEGGFDYDRKKDVVRAVHGMLHDSVNQPVDLKNVEGFVNALLPKNLQDDFDALCNTEGYPVSSTFKPTATILKKQMQCTLKTPRWKMTFDREIFGHINDQGATIRFNPENSTLTFLNLPEKAINEIKQMLADKGQGEDHAS
jgi:nucleoid-associated protein